MMVILLKGCIGPSLMMDEKKKKLIKVNFYRLHWVPLSLEE